MRSDVRLIVSLVALSACGGSASEIPEPTGSPRSVTQGGPQDLTHLVATYAHMIAIRSHQFGLGAAASLFMAPVLAIVVWLQVSAEEAWRRVEGSGRPLAKDRNRFEELHREREPIYARLADAVLPPADEELVSRALPSLVSARNRSAR